MTVTKRLHGGHAGARAARWMAVPAAIVALALGGAPAAAAASGSPAAAVKCAAVLFVGARGTGEAGPGSPNWVATSADPYGLGGPVNALRKALLTDIAGRRTVQTVSVDYNTNDVGTLLTDPVSYFADLQSGVDWTFSYLTQWAVTCPNQRIVLAGYSQGAMVMHRVMHLLGTKMMSRVTAAVLIADGDQVPGDNVTRYGSASLAAVGAGQYPLFSSISGSSPATFSTTIVGSRVLSICNAGDIVCDTNAGDLNAAGIATHLAYTSPISGAATKPLRDAAAQAFVMTVVWASRKLPPLPADAQSAELRAIACPSTSECVAVGDYKDSNAVSHGLLLTGSGSTWTAATAPLPANAGSGLAGAYLFGVACPSTSMCAAVGSYTDSSGNSQGLLLTWLGSTWTAAEAPVPANAYSTSQPELSAVACPSTSECVAVGNYTDSSFGFQGLLVTWSGGNWTAAEAPLPANAGSDPYAFLNAVACSAASACVAAGHYMDSTGCAGCGNVLPLLLTQSGSTWTAAEAPLPANAASDPGASLNAVACSTSSACVVVGTYTSTADVATVSSSPFLVTGSAGTWTAAEAPLPANAVVPGPATQSAPLNAVACPSTKACIGAGQYWPDDTGSPQGLLVTRAGGGWIAGELLPASAGPLGANLQGISCPSVSRCTAVGAGSTWPILVTG